MLLCFLTSTAYFAYHGVYGRHGLETRNALLQRQSDGQFELQNLEQARAKLQRDVALLSSDVPDADLVADIARDVLGYVHPDEVILSAN